MCLEHASSLAKGRACFLLLIERGIFGARFLWFSMVYRSRNVTFEARLFWYVAERARNITLLNSARFAF